MTREECLTLIYNECMRIEDKHKKTIVCCFNSRKVMQDFIQAVFDKFIYVRGIKINLDPVSTFLVLTVLTLIFTCCWMAVKI